MPDERTPEPSQPNAAGAPVPAGGALAGGPDAGAESGAAARCALHADRLASRTCGRCGNFLCTTCAIPVQWANNSFCKDCLTRMEAAGTGGVLPWEDTKVFFFVRFWRTVYDVIFSPMLFFSKVGTTGYGPAMTFQYNAMPYVLGLNLALTYARFQSWFSGTFSPKQLSQMWTSTLISTLLVAAMIPILHFVLAGWLHVHLVLLGAKRGFAATYRLTSYLYALFFVFALVQLVTHFTQGDVTPAQLSAMMRGEMQVGALIATLLTSTIGFVYTAIAAAKVHRMHPAATFTAAMLVGLEAFALYKFLILPIAQRGADAMRF